ncbi:hypothetical protein BH11BAC2_BH11BAC2_13400 [soil metagenome]
MNHYLIGGLLLILMLFSLGVKLNRDPWDLGSSIGYRTTFSRKNDETWYEANMYAGRCLMLMATLLMLLLMLSEIYIGNRRALFMIMGGGVFISLIAVIIFTEKHLRKVFFRDGKRRPTIF